MTGKPDTYSPTTVRVLLTAAAIVLVVLAVLFTGGWATWAFVVLAVILFCAAVTPPFRNPRP